MEDQSLFNWVKIFQILWCVWTLSGQKQNILDNISIIAVRWETDAEFSLDWGLQLDQKLLRITQTLEILDSEPMEKFGL